VQRNLEQSLVRLQTDRIDVLQFHGGRAEELERNGLIDQLLQFKAEGTVRCIGISTKLPDIAAHIALGVFDTFQVPYSCLAPEHDQWIRLAAESGAGIIIRGGIAQGGPDAEIQRPALNEVWEKAQLNELLPPGMDRAELILRYTLGHPHCHTTIVGTCNAEHLAANVAAANAGPLSTGLQQAIAQRVAAVTC
jgi:aryl-alcohol dehydrogenase-like predicted oxidoreductase